MGEIASRRATRSTGTMPQLKPRQRIAWITPEFPPDRGGVSDHTHWMAEALRTLGHEVLVCAHPQDRGFLALDAELRAFQPDLIVVAFVPLGFAPRTLGVSLPLLVWARALSARLRAKKVLFAHEASLPASQLWRAQQWKLALLASAQVAQFHGLIGAFDGVLFSNEGTRREWSRRAPRLASRFQTCRICSNIPFVETPDAGAALASAQQQPAPDTVLFFGTGHDSILFDYVEAAFSCIAAANPTVELVIVGMDRSKLQQRSPSLAGRGSQVRALGYVDGTRVSLWLQHARLVLAPLIEGVSARKGTVMAALQHGCTVVTTRGPHTLEDIAWDEICLAAPLERAQFARVALQAYQDPALRARFRQAARAEYEENASPLATAARVLALAHGSPGGHLSDDRIAR